MLNYLLLIALAMFLLLYILKFVRVLWELDLHIVFPLKKEVASVWILPQKPVNKPSYRGQKNGIIFYSSYLSFIILSCFLIWRFHPEPFIMNYLLIMFPLFYSNDLMNLYAVTENGILTGTRFMSWKKIDGYDIIKVDANHKYYGYSPEINDEYEIKVYGKLFTQSCIVSSAETREKLIGFLEDKGIKERVNDLKNIVEESEGYRA